MKFRYFMQCNNSYNPDKSNVKMIWNVDQGLNSIKFVFVLGAKHLQLLQRYKYLKYIFSSETSSPPEVLCVFIKKGTLAQVFSCEFCEISKNTFFNTPLVAASATFGHFVTYCDNLIPNLHKFIPVSTSSFRSFNTSAL